MRTVGACAHVVNIMWYFGVGRHLQNFIGPASAWDDIIIDMRFLKTSKGGTMLILDGYTYSKNSSIRKGGARFTCSKKLKNCKAVVHMSKIGEILKADTLHNHEPPKYIVTARYITTTRGVKLLLLDEYTFSKNSPLRAGGKRYSCSSNVSKNCKAYVHVDVNDMIVYRLTDHNHEPMKYHKTIDGLYMKL
ncbi:hypothetical protein ACJJTC_012615 [Scirpophaga incertulas]